MNTWMKSKTGMYHLYGGTSGGKPIAECQSYNLDRPNYLLGAGVSVLPENSKVCKKCLSHLKCS